MQLLPGAEAPAQPSSPAALRLLDEGFLIIENAVPAGIFARVNAELEPHFDAAPFGTGAFYGPETKRFGRALARSAALADLVLDAAIFGLVGEVLGPQLRQFAA